MSVDAVNSTNINRGTQGTSDRKNKREAVAAGAGGAAGVAGSTKVVSKIKKGEPAFKSTVDGLKNVVSTLNKNKSTSGRLVNSFRANAAKFSADILKRLEKLSNSKLLGTLVKSPAARGVSAVLGGILAFFVLVTGVNKAVNTGELALDNLRLKKSQFLEVA